MIKQPTNILKIRILSETSNILYLIRYASFILSAGLHPYRRVPTSEHCWKKNSGSQQGPLDYKSNAFPTELGGLMYRVGFKHLLYSTALYSAIYSYNVIRRVTT